MMTFSSCFSTPPTVAFVESSSTAWRVLPLPLRANGTSGSGEPVANYYTSLRMGANYAWPRGVTWLMKNRILGSSLPR